jgi:hypothetical protein
VPASVLLDPWSPMSRPGNREYTELSVGCGKMRSTVKETVEQ